MFRQLRQFDFNKLGKNILGAILTPPATVFATTGDADKAKHAGLLGLGAAALIVIGFIQQPYKCADETSSTEKAPTEAACCQPNPTAQTETRSAENETAA